MQGGTMRSIQRNKERECGLRREKGDIKNGVLEIQIV